MAFAVVNGKLKMTHVDDVVEGAGEGGVEGLAAV
jgi:hypothetical protein